MPAHSSRSLASPLAVGVLVGLIAALAACGGTPPKPLATLPSGSTGSVKLQSDLTAYRTTQPIGITLHNTGKTTYYVQTGQSECTPVQMQRQVGATWQNVMPCSATAQSHVSAITPGLAEPFTFAPGNAPSDPNAWAPGVYRFALQLTTSANGAGATTLVYSAGVRISAPSS
jgi:hypothetical protein